MVKDRENSKLKKEQRKLGVVPYPRYLTKLKILNYSDRHRLKSIYCKTFIQNGFEMFFKYYTLPEMKSCTGAYYISIWVDHFISLSMAIFFVLLLF